MHEYIFSTYGRGLARAKRPTSASWRRPDKWALTEADDHQRVWTDDYSNVLGAVWRRLRNGEE